MPQISVIVPVYKAKDYLDRCVTSILAQTFSDFELILVDDGSPDNSGELCDEYAQKDPRVHVIHKENGGAATARNAGLDWAFDHSDSQWLAFIDSDDWIHPEYLERLLNVAVEHDAGVSACGYYITEGENPTFDADQLNPVQWNTENFYVEHNMLAVVPWGKLCSKESFRSIRYPAGRYCEDEFTTYQVLFQFPSVTFVEAPLYCYYVNQAGLSKSGNNPRKEDVYEALEQQIQYFKEHGFMVACRSQIRMYMIIVHGKIQQLSQEPGSEEALKKMKRRMRQTFPRYIRLLKPDEKNSDGWVLNRVYPKRMKIYWKVRAVMRKLKIIK